MWSCFSVQYVPVKTEDVLGYWGGGGGVKFWVQGFLEVLLEAVGIFAPIRSSPSLKNVISWRASWEQNWRFRVIFWSFISCDENTIRRFKVTIPTKSIKNLENIWIVSWNYFTYKARLLPGKRVTFPPQKL